MIWGISINFRFIHLKFVLGFLSCGSKCAFANLSLAFWRNKVMGEVMGGGPRDRHRSRKFQQRFYGWNMPIHTSFFSASSKDRNPQNLMQKALNIRTHPWTPTKSHGEKQVVFSSQYYGLVWCPMAPTETKQHTQRSNDFLLRPRRQQCVDQLSSYWQQCRQLLQAWPGESFKKGAGIAQASLSSEIFRKKIVFFLAEFQPPASTSKSPLHIHGT